MASFPKVATDFDAIIQADRQRRKNEELAKEIFGRNKQKDNKKKDDKRPGRISTPSLASRIGIAKRSSSTSSNAPSPRFQNKPRNSLPSQNARANRLANELNLETNKNIQPIPTQPSAQTVTSVTSTVIGGGISIKGASGPFVLHASNFAPGTTAADIESALHPDTLYNNGVSSLVSCKIVDTRPDVVAELVFTEKVVAENIISKYNGQKADGRILRVELVRSGVGAMSKAQVPVQQPPSQPQQRNRQAKPQPPAQPVIQQPELDFEPELEMADASAMEDIEMDATETSNASATNFVDEREAADRDRHRRDRDSRREKDEHYDDKRQGEDDRRRGDRDLDRDRERERDRERNRDRDREYERRDERRGTMASHYGNGVGPGQRGGAMSGGGGGYGGGPGGYRGGRFDNGYGAGGRGGYRGGFRGYR